MRWIRRSLMRRIRRPLRRRITNRSGAEQGSTSLSALVFGLGLALALVMGAALLTHVMAAHQARSGADLAALAAAVEAAAGRDDSQACHQAGLIAEANGGWVTGCEVVQAGTEVAVRVETATPLAWSWPGGPVTVAAVAHAGNPADP